MNVRVLDDTAHGLGNDRMAQGHVCLACLGNPSVLRARRSRAGDGSPGEHDRDRVRGRRRSCCRRRNSSKISFRDHGSAGTLGSSQCECMYEVRYE